MRPSDFTHLHVHSDASIIDGLGTVEHLVEAAAAKGFTALALTDHGSLANAVLFTINCEAHGIKPLLGVEGYIVVDGEVGHITLLADGDAGFRNLVALNNTGHFGTMPKPAFTVDDLIKHADGLLCLTGCPASPFNNLGERDATSLAARLKSVFGSRLFAEIMFVADIDTWTRPIHLSERLGLKLVATNDVHFPNREDAEIHPILTSMKAGFTYSSRNLWLKQPDAIMEAGKFRVDESIVLDAMTRAGQIGQKLRRVNLAREPHLPESAGGIRELRAKVMERFSSLGLYWDHVHGGRETPLERVNYELGVIEKMGYASYFTILSDIVAYSKSHGVKVGPGRGSGAASLVLFLLNVTTVDPLKYGLSFERFLNPYRKGMPDVDVDFDSERRDVAINYAVTNWNATPVATYARYSHKTLVHDLAKTLKIPRDIEAVAAEKGPESAEFKELQATVPNFEAAYNTILGQVRHKGKHAGGVVITDGVIPLERAGDSLVAAWTEGDHRELSYAGIVKFDLLGLSALAVLRRLETRFERVAEDSWDNHPAFEIFRSGDLQGIFQFTGSSGIRELTMKLEPTHFDDLVAINALYRPGALDVGSTAMYPEWKKTPREVPTFISDILAPTYGAVVYQEQVMEIFARVTGGSLGEADLARRVIVKAKPGDPKWEEEMGTISSKFISSAIEHGMTPKESERFWEELASHSRYSFNKAHSVAYAQIAWEMAWWKFTHRSAFYAEMLNVDPTEAQAYIFDAVMHGVHISTPDVNSAGVEYTYGDDGTIYVPLSSVKYLGEKGANAIIASRDEKGRFLSLEDFMARVPKRTVTARARKGLLAIGAFGTLAGHDADDRLKRLGIKSEVEAFEVNRFSTMGEHLGFIIPDTALMATINGALERYDVAGIVQKSKEKESRYGKYTVYYLLPNGVFWSRDTVEIEDGDVVAANVNAKSGRLLQFMKLI